VKMGQLNSEKSSAIVWEGSAFLKKEQAPYVGPEGKKRDAYRMVKNDGGNRRGKERQFAPSPQDLRAIPAR